MIRHLRDLLSRATPGPWSVSDDEPGDVVLYGPDENWMANIGNWARQHPEIDAKAAARQVCEFRDAADAELIAAMHAALPALLDVAEAARKVRNLLLDMEARQYIEDEYEALSAALAKLETP